MRVEMPTIRGSSASRAVRLAARGEGECARVGARAHAIQRRRVFIVNLGPSPVSSIVKEKSTARNRSSGRSTHHPVALAIADEGAPVEDAMAPGSREWTANPRSPR